MADKPETKNDDLEVIENLDFLESMDLLGAESEWEIMSKAEELEKANAVTESPEAAKETSP